jgi:hypothetical protein
MRAAKKVFNKNLAKKGHFLAVLVLIKNAPPPRRAPHRGAWYESPRPRHGGFAADETCPRAGRRG